MSVKVNEDQDQLRDGMIVAANRLIERGHNHDALSVSAVARELGVAPASVYEQFPDKLSLMLAVYQRYFSLLSHHIDRVVGEFTDPDAQLRGAAIAYCQFASEYPDAYYVMFSLPGAPNGLPDEQLPGCSIRERMTGIITDCITAGLMHPVDPYEATLCLWAGLHGLVTLRTARPYLPWPSFESLVDTLLSEMICSADGLAAARGDLQVPAGLGHDEHRARRVAQDVLADRAEQTGRRLRAPGGEDH